MQDTQQDSQKQAEAQSAQTARREALRRAEKKTFAMKVFGLILKYKDSAVFQWVNRHHVLSLALVAIWGMLIVGLFLFWVIYNIMRQSPQ